MSLLLVGLNHRTAPLDVRERYAVPGRDLQGLDEKIAREPGCDEAVLVSTCNRTELLVVTSDPAAAGEQMHGVFTRQIGDGSAHAAQLYELRDRDAIAHVFRVAASLDSMVLGEAQILGQLKDAYRAAVAAHSCGPVLHRLFQRAFRAAKRVRTETGLGASSVSVARVGVQLAAEVFESFEGKRVALVGAGDMAESALFALRDAGADHLVVLNRTLAAAQRLAARLDARPGSLDALAEELATADIAIASVQVESPLVTRDLLAGCIPERQGRPLLLVDLGIPRNVDPAVNELDPVVLYDLDDLEDLAERGLEQRRLAVAPAEAILRAEADAFERWIAALDAVPAIRELTRWAEELVRAELERHAGTGADPEALERLARSLQRKLLHRPLEHLRREAEEGLGAYYTDAVRALYGLPGEEE